jgi:hypothetical protein
MRGKYLLTMMSLTILVATSVLLKATPMMANQNYLEEAQSNANAFEESHEPERLRAAYLALENVILGQEKGDPGPRAHLRMECLRLWLHLLDLLDRSLDPNFEVGDVPVKIVEPPAVPGDIVLRPGADPAKIADPKARAEYESAIAANRVKANNYREQIGLRRLNEHLPTRVEAYIQNSYTSVRSDQEELRTAIDGLIKSPRRKADLLRLLEPPRP